MREILFIGKRKDNGEWVEGYYIVGLGFIRYIIPKYSLKNAKEYGGYEAINKTFYPPNILKLFPKPSGSSRA